MPLTKRELEVLKLLSVGRTNKEIAHELCISVSTAGNHLRSIFPKLGVHNRTEAVLSYAARRKSSKVSAIKKARNRQ